MLILVGGCELIFSFYNGVGFGIWMVSKILNLFKS